MPLLGCLALGRERVAQVVGVGLEGDHHALAMSTGSHEASVAGAFTVLDFPADNGDRPEPPTVYSENLTGALYLDKPAEISQDERAWRTLDGFALSDADSVALLVYTVDEWRAFVGGVKDGEFDA